MPVTATTTQNLPVMEAFYSLQGEGYHTGKAAYFIRLGGCDVGCHWCDVKESWDADKHPRESIAQIIAGARKHEPAIVIITGGEPLMYPLDELCQGLKDSGLRTHLETSGCYALSGQWDWICFSPKKFKAPLPDIYEQAHELKVVVFNRSDLAWAQSHADKVNSQCKLYLQPEWSKAAEVTPLIIDFIKSHPQWKISLQTHKYLNIP